MLKIGVTGGIGSGKSLVCQVFKALGIPVFIADMVGGALLYSNQDVIDQITKVFGPKAFDSYGWPDKQYISQTIFDDTANRDKMNQIVHPHVFSAFQQWSSQQTAPYIIMEAAILFESGANKLLDKTIMVYSNIELRTERVLAREGMGPALLEKIFKAQMPEEEKVKLSNHIIYNDEKTLLLPQILKIHNTLLDG